MRKDYLLKIGANMVAVVGIILLIIGGANWYIV